MNTIIFGIVAALATSMVATLVFGTSFVAAQMMEDNATMGGNVTGGNMTMEMGNMTDVNMADASGSISGVNNPFGD